ncbi:Vesicle transport v-SNARE protein [Histomonas meleagridis]|uniref:Vesicle transport v-SNARE protein n=1 Tax=Histomonas meleagridis TaxID=135588 RepID=UPI00355A6D6C|nr:Vesicle transport v-SNARE protein [Histomonas meleagridis]KAH0798402.1 Vesicle transport v-SNARE protein [Histomonas meleagridis]
MTQFSLFERSINDLMVQLDGEISNYSSQGGNSDNQRKIENLLNELNSNMEELDRESILMDADDNLRAVKFLKEIRQKKNTMENRYNMAKNRNELLGSPRNLDGSSQSQRDQLVSQRDKLNQGSALLQEMHETVNGIKGTGFGIIDELGIQAEKENKIMNGLYEVESGADQGYEKAEKMLCRQKRRTAILWIVIVIILVILLVVFLYFVFK